jgi:hypothetical protein
MSSDQIILYDLPSKPPCQSWSLNPWKSTRQNHHPFYAYTDTTLARLLLNYKGIPYKTEWIEYPDVEPKFKSL